MRDFRLRFRHTEQRRQQVNPTDLQATLPTSLVEDLGERLGLRVITAPVPGIATEIKLVWHERTAADPAMRSFRELVSRTVGSG